MTAPLASKQSLRFCDFFFEVGIAPTANLEQIRIGSDQANALSATSTHKDSYVNFDEIRESPVPRDAIATSEVVAEDFSQRGRKPRKINTEQLSRTASSPIDLSLMTPCTAKMKRQHPIEYKYETEVLCRYPSNDYISGEKFPRFLPMFCFPNDASLRHGQDGPPPSTFHSFIITEESGAKLYGSCVTIYEKLHPMLASQLEVMLEDWRSECLAQSDLEYIQHIQRQLAVNQEAILKIRNGATTDPRNPDPHAEELSGAELHDLIAEAEEKVALFKELLGPLESLLVDVESIYAPRSIGLLSHWPWHDIFTDWIRELIKVVTGSYEDSTNRAVSTYAPLERCLVNIAYEVPLPPPGRVELRISIGQLQLFCSRPPVNTIQMLQNFSLYPLFRSMSTQNIVTLFELGLMEKKIIFLSSYASMLTLAAESLCLLMYPLTWQHILVPLLPAKLLSYLQAPMPFIIGVLREYFSKTEQDEWRPADAVLVDLDNNTIDIPDDFELPTIPIRDRKKLVARLHKYTGLPVPTGSNSNVSAPEAMRGVPLTVKFAYPNRTLVPFSNMSKRWIHSDVEMTSSSKAAHQKNVKPEGSRRGSMESLTGSSAPFAVVSTPVSGASAFFGKVNRNFIGSSARNSKESFNSSTEKVGTGSQSYLHKLSVSVGSTERVAADSFEGKSEGLLIPEQKQNESGRRRTKSASPEYGDPNTLPPLAPLVLSGDVPGYEYTGIPLKVDDGNESVTDVQSPGSSIITPLSPERAGGLFGKPDELPLNFNSILTTLTSVTTPTPATTRSSTLPRRHRNTNSDTMSMISRQQFSVNRFPMVAGSTTSSAATSPTYFNPSVSNNGTFIKSSDHSSSHGAASKRFEGHAFVECYMEPPNREADIDLDEYETPGSQTSMLTTALARNVHTTDASASPSTGSNEHLGVTRSDSVKLSTSLHQLSIKAKLSGTEYSTEQIVQSSQSATPTGRRQVNGSTVLLKGDFMPKMPEHLCRMCQGELWSSEPTEVFLKCETCAFSVHSKCIPLIECHPCIGIFNERKIQASFLKIFTSLLKNYRSHLVIPEQVKAAMADDAGGGNTENDGSLSPAVASIQGMDLVQDDWFKKEDFLKSADKESIPFLKNLVGTQAFAQFTLDRIERPESDYEILFFDESIKAKLNRSRLKLSKETTPFLKDSTYNIRATVAIAPPNLENLEPNRTYSTTVFPIALDESLLINGRPVHPLVTQSDQKMMRSHTNELVQRARLVSGMKRKQDFSKWMRTKLKHFQKIGGGEVVSIGHLSDEQRRELFEERIKDVTEVIDRCEGAHLSSLTADEIHSALEELHSQHLILMRAADEEQLVDSSDQDELQNIYNRLFRVMTIYEDHQGAFESPVALTPDDIVVGPRTSSYSHPLGQLAKDVNKEIIERGVEKKVKTVWKKVEKEVSLVSLPSSVRSRSSSLRNFAGRKGLTITSLPITRESPSKTQLSSSTSDNTTDQASSSTQASPLLTATSAGISPSALNSTSPKRWVTPESVAQQSLALELPQRSQSQTPSQLLHQTSSKDLAHQTNQVISLLPPPSKDSKPPTLSRKSSSTSVGALPLELDPIAGLSKLVQVTRAKMGSVGGDGADDIMAALDNIRDKIEGTTPKAESPASTPRKHNRTVEPSQ